MKPIIRAKRYISEGFGYYGKETIMKRLVILSAGSLLFALFSFGCAHTSVPAPPADLFAIDPETACEHESLAGGLDIKATLYETPDTDYLVLYFNAPKSTIVEPRLKLQASFPVFIKQTGNVYYYRLGKLPKGKKVGEVWYPTWQRARARGGMVDELQGVELERRDGTNCLKVIEK